MRLHPRWSRDGGFVRVEVDGEGTCIAERRAENERFELVAFRSAEETWRLPIEGELVDWSVAEDGSGLLVHRRTGDGHQLDRFQSKTAARQWTRTLDGEYAEARILDGSVLRNGSATALLVPSRSSAEVIRSIALPAPLVGSIAVSRPGSVVAVCGGQLVDVDLAKAEITRSFEISGVALQAAQAAIADSCYVVLSDLGLAAFDRENGTRLWSRARKNPFLDRTVSEPGAALTSMFCDTRCNMLYGNEKHIGHDDFIAIDLDTGKVAWSFRGDAISGRISLVPAVLRSEFGPVVAFSCSDGKLYVAGAMTGKHLATWNAGRPIESALGVLDGGILVACDRLTMFDLS